MALAALGTTQLDTRRQTDCNRGDIMRSLVALLTTFVLVACGTAPTTRDPSNPPNASMNPAVEFLLTSAATDFHTHRPPYPARFRDVRSGYLMAPDGTRQYRLCGEFLPAQEGSEAEWTPFVTIKTSGYEQWLGSQALSYCNRPSMTWDMGDLSSSLQSRLDALR
jgi:hypothetical protein